MKNKKKFLFAALLLLGIGFASISTTLYINGTTKITTNEEEYKVIFTETSKGEISDDGKTISYESGDYLRYNGDYDELNFTVSNNSSQYDSDVSLNCYIDDNWFDISISIGGTEMDIYNGNSVTIDAKDSSNGTLRVTKVGPASEDATYHLSCTLDADALEKSIDD